jgi:pentatricopeptide repeat protein
MFCLAYIDNILIHSLNLKKHSEHMVMILQELQEVGVQVDIV